MLLGALYKMKKKWFYATETIVLLLYIVFSTLTYIGQITFSHIYIVNTVVDIIASIFAMLVINRYIDIYTSKADKVLSFIFVVIIMLRTMQKESFAGLILGVIILITLIYRKNKIELVKKTMDIFLWSIVTIEIVSLIYEFKIIDILNEIDSWATSRWIDLVFVVVIGLYVGCKKLESYIVKFIPAAFVLFGIIGVVILLSDIYTVGMCMELSAKQLQNGMQISVYDAENRDRAIAVEYNNIEMSTNPDSNNNTLTLEKVDEDGYWKIKSNYGNVLDVESALFENGNGVCVWEENGGTNQLWKIEDVDAENGIVRIVSYDSEYAMSYNSSTNEMIITNDEIDTNQHFYIKGDVVQKRSIIESALYNGYTKACVMYCAALIILILLILTSYTFFRKIGRYN